MRYGTAPLLAPIVACALCVAPAWAQEEENPDTLQSEPESVSAGVDVSQAPPVRKSASGIEYRSGGVGKEERDALHLVAARYPLKIVLAAGGDRAFVSDATLRVSDASGKAVFEADGVGPLVFVDLPPGTYAVAVTAQGATKQQTASLSSAKQTAISFGW